MKRRPVSLLFMLLAASALLAAAAGMLTRNTVCRAANIMQDQGPFQVLAEIAQAQGLPESAPPLPTPVLAVSEPEPEPERTREEILLGPGLTNAPPDSPVTRPSYSLEPVDISYFDRALFVGDSRTVGLALYGRLGQADYFADVGMSVFNVLTRETEDVNFAKCTLPDLLSEREYDKIYIMLGLNELRMTLEEIMAQYQLVTAYIRALQPEALLILCANLNVTAQKSANTDWLSQEAIAGLNSGIAALTDGESIVYLDVNPFFSGPDGCLDPELTADGVHPYATGYAGWSVWLQENAVVIRSYSGAEDLVQ